MPSSYTLYWEVAGDVQLARAFHSLAIDLTDYREPLREIAKDVIYPEIRHQFQAQGDPSWAQLSPSYRRWKERRYPGRTIMRLTGALEASLTRQRARGSIYRLTKLLLEIGTQLEVNGYNLGLLHQKPTEGTRPVRATMLLRPSAQTQAVMICAGWFRRRGLEEGVGL